MTIPAPSPPSLAAAAMAFLIGVAAPSDPPPAPEAPPARPAAFLPIVGTAIGPASCHDGDTCNVGQVKVRLWGIAAPEVARFGKPPEEGGEDARDALRALVQGRDVTCLLTDLRTFERVAGMCFVDGVDLGYRMVAAGHARDCARYSRGYYLAAEGDRARSLTLPGYCVPRRQGARTAPRRPFYPDEREDAPPALTPSPALPDP